MARVKFFCDVERCIDCGGCVVACKEGNHVPVGVNRRRVVTLNQGKPGEKAEFEGLKNSSEQIKIDQFAKIEMSL